MLCSDFCVAIVFNILSLLAVVAAGGTTANQHIESMLLDVPIMSGEKARTARVSVCIGLANVEVLLDLVVWEYHVLALQRRPDAPTSESILSSGTGRYWDSVRRGLRCRNVPEGWVVLVQASLCSRLPMPCTLGSLLRECCISAALPPHHKGDQSMSTPRSPACLDSALSPTFMHIGARLQDISGAKIAIP